MAKYKFELTGISPLLMHADDVERADDLQLWQRAPENKNLSVPGDDRSPPWTWQGYLYTDGELLTIPGDNIMVALRFAGAKITLKGQTTFKKLSQSGLIIGTEHCEFFAGGKPVTLASIAKLRPLSFAEQAQAVKKLGFDLYVKRAKIPNKDTKNVRVRARFEEWSVNGTVEVVEDAITPAILKQMFEIAGSQSGICDWRPSSPKSPGPFGKFEAKVAACK